jgi:glycosyltransferase involved in cell wall biosynthesis
MFDNGASSTVAPLKILMTADAVGGVWQYSVDLIVHLAARGAHVLLATMGPRPSEAQKVQLAALGSVTLRESDFKLEWMQAPWADVDAAGSWLLDLAEQFQPDIVHLNGYTHAGLRWPAPVVVVAHSCVYSWWQAVYGTAPPADEWSEYHRRVSAGLRAADVVIAPSASMALALSAHYGLAPSRTHVIHNLSESPLLAGAQKQNFFLAAGRTWDVGKNLQMLTSFEARLPWPLRVAESMTHETLLAHMQQASVYVHPALYEPFGLAVLEAARAKCCLVLSDIPSLRELWNGAAIFVDPRNPEAWVSVLSAIADDPSRRESLARLAQTHSARYSSLVTVEQYWRTYQALSVPEGAAA